MIDVEVNFMSQVYFIGMYPRHYGSVDIHVFSCHSGSGYISIIKFYYLFKIKPFQ